MLLTDDERDELLQALIKLGTKTKVKQPIVKELKEECIELEMVTVKGQKAFLLGYGDGRNGAKELIKSVGFFWNTALRDNNRKGAWCGTLAQFKKLETRTMIFKEGTEKEHKGIGLVVPKEWVQKGRDKAMNYNKN